MKTSNEDLRAWRLKNPGRWMSYSLIIPKSISLGPTNYSVPKTCKPFFSVFIDQGVYQNWNTKTIIKLLYSLSK